MAAHKRRGKNGINHSEWDRDSATDASSEGEKPLLKRADFICSTGHNKHLNEDYEPNETLLVGRKIRRPKLRIVETPSIESQSITSFPSDLTLSSHTSLDVLPSAPVILKGKHLQTVPEEAERNYPHYSASSRAGLGTNLVPGMFPTNPVAASSSKNVTPQTIKKVGFLGRLWISEDLPHKTVDKKLDFYDMAAANHNSDAEEPYTDYGTPRDRKRDTSRTLNNRLLMPRESIVHPAGPFNEPLDAYNETSYATAYDPMSGRQRLVRRDSVIHPNEDGRSLGEIRSWGYKNLPGRRDSIVRPLQMQRSPSLDPRVSFYKDEFVARSDIVSRDVVDVRREESIKKHLLNHRAHKSAFSSFENVDGLPAPKYINGRFEVPWETQHKPGLFEAIRWKLTSANRSRVPKEDELKRYLPIIKPNFKKTPETGIRVTWLGHSTLLIQMDTVVILTDPVFSDRASPLWLMGPKRYRRPPCPISSLPQIDIVLISHNHYDHLDGGSVRALNVCFGNNLHWFVPLGLQDWMKNIGCRNVYEMSWWEETRPIQARDILVAFTPAQHWCKRALTDENKVLWGSWCVVGPRHNFFFAGDTGYCNVFKLIGEKYGPFDLAAIPIGAYEPRQFMKLQNVNPYEAVLIHEDLYARHSIGIHWGTFALSSEHYLAPRKDLTEALNRRALAQDVFFTLSHGESKIVAGTMKTLF